MRTAILFTALLGLASADELPVKEPPAKEPPAAFLRIAAIRIPKIHLESCTVDEMVDFLRLRIAELDPEEPGGISILLAGFSPRITTHRAADGTIVSVEREVPGRDYQAANVRVDRVLMDTSKLYQIDYHVTSVGLVVTPAGLAPFPNPRAKTGKALYTYSNKPDKAP